MVPIHESDLAEQRWAKVEWENYVLWEKVEHRLKKQRRLWVFLTLLIFTALSAVPIVADRWPKWTTRSIVRHLAEELNWVKRQASIHHGAYRFRFDTEGRLTFSVERLENCSATRGEVVKSGALGQGLGDDYTWIPSSVGRDFDIPGLVSSFCYDSLDGSDEAKKGEKVSGFAVISVRDLTQRRLDRMSILLFMGPSGDISFD